MTEAGKDILEMMNAWNHIMAAMKLRHPSADPETLYQMSSKAFSAALKLGGA